MGPTARAGGGVLDLAVLRWSLADGGASGLDGRDRDRTGGQRGWTEKLIERARQRDGETRQQVIWIVRRPEKTRCDPWELPLVSTPSVAVPRPAAVSPPFLFFFVFWFFSFLFFFPSLLLLLLFSFFFLPSVLLYKSMPLHVTGRLPWPQTPSYWPAARSTSHSGGRDLRHPWLP